MFFFTGVISTRDLEGFYKQTSTDSPNTDPVLEISKLLLLAMLKLAKKSLRVGLQISPVVVSVAR